MSDVASSGSWTQIEGREGLAGLVRGLSAAMTRDEIHRAYLSRVGTVLGAQAFAIYHLRGAHTIAPDGIAANVQEDFLAEYEVRGRADDPVLEFAVRLGQPVDSSTVPASHWDGSGARHVLARTGLAHSLQAPVIVDGELVGTINFARDTASPPFCDRELSRARALSEHLALALSRARRYEALECQITLLEGALDRSSRAAIVCDAQGDPQFVTSSARRLMGGDLLESQFGTQVTEAIQRFARAEALVETQHLSEQAAGRRMILQFQRFRHGDALVCFLHPNADVRHSALPAVDVLSPREQHIAGLVARGLTTRAMAKEAFISENTVKQHLKRIFMKLGVTSRAELIQLIWTLNDKQPAGLDSNDGFDPNGSSAPA